MKPLISVPPYSKTYDGKTVTLADLTAKATATLNGQAVAGSWALAADAPTLHDAGSYRVALTFTPDDAKLASVETTVTVEIAKRPVDVYLQLGSNRITTGEALPQIWLVYEGVVEGESLIPDKNPQVSGVPTEVKAGVYTLRWVNSEEMKGAIEALPAAKNYSISYQTQTTLTIVEGQTLTPPAAGEDQAYRLELTNALPDKVAGYDSQQKIRDALVGAAKAGNDRVTSEQTACYDLTLYIGGTGATDWNVADGENFPAEGITVTLPYPAGTNASSHDFIVAHMFTADIGGHKAGEVELPAVTETADGLRFTVRSLSPVSVSWIAAPTATETPEASPEPTAAPTAAPAPTATPAATKAPSGGGSSATAAPTSAPVITPSPTLAPSEVEAPSGPNQQAQAVATPAPTPLPTTADSAPIGMWIALLAAGAGGLAIVGGLLLRRRGR